jgi:hypothetical protein
MNDFEAAKIAKEFESVLSFYSEEMYATVYITESGDGYSSEWLISGKYGNQLRVLMHGNLPIYGDNLADAMKRVGFIKDSVFEFARTVSGGSGDVPATGSRSWKYLSGMHVGSWGHKVREVPILERTAMLYEFLSSLKIHNPAEEIAELDGVSTRTVHDRIARARLNGLLKSFGRGKSY